MSRLCWLGMAALALAAFAQAKEEKIAVKDLPKAVVAVVNAMFPDGQIVEAEKETETRGGKTVVEIEVTVKPKSLIRANADVLFAGFAWLTGIIDVDLKTM